jgi:hypothetical protein
MEFPQLEIGLVISYSYLWSDEAEAGHVEGRKNRGHVRERGRPHWKFFKNWLPVTDYSALRASPLRGRPAGDRHRRCAALSSNRRPTAVIVSEGFGTWTGNCRGHLY